MFEVISQSVICVRGTFIYGSKNHELSIACFIFSSYLIALGSSCLDFSKVLKKLIGKNNMIEFMFTNPAGKQR